MTALAGKVCPERVKRPRKTEFRGKFTAGIACRQAEITKILPLSDQVSTAC
jgi:hypothetical protein